MDDQIKDILSRLTKLENAIFDGGKRLSSKTTKTIGQPKFDFTLNERAFIKRHFLKLNGQQTFALICSFLAKGKEDVPVNLSAIKKLWKNCLGIIDYPYSSIYSTRAKENGWVTPAKKGTYSIRSSWIEIFN